MDSTDKKVLAYMDQICEQAEKKAMETGIFEAFRIEGEKDQYIVIPLNQKNFKIILFFSNFILYL